MINYYSQSMNTQLNIKITGGAESDQEKGQMEILKDNVKIWHEDIWLQWLKHRSSYSEGRSG